MTFSFSKEKLFFLFASFLHHKNWFWYTECFRFSLLPIAPSPPTQSFILYMNVCSSIVYINVVITWNVLRLLTNFLDTWIFFDLLDERIKPLRSEVRRLKRLKIHICMVYTYVCSHKYTRTFSHSISVPHIIYRWLLRWHTKLMRDVI